MLVLVDWFSVDHLLARVDQGGPGQIIETGSSSYRIVHARNARPASYGPRGTPDVYRDTAEVVGPAPRPHCLCDHGR